LFKKINRKASFYLIFASDKTLKLHFWKITL
jgi:hypothetical protein